MKVDSKLNFLFVELFQSILEAEEKSIITGEFQDITINDMHVIEAIGDGKLKTSSEVAKRLGVTMGTLTKSIDGLVRKNYVQRNRSESDKRLVLLSLLPKGQRAFKKHADFHAKMVDAAISQFEPEETKLLEKALGNLEQFFVKQRNILENHIIERKTV